MGTVSSSTLLRGLVDLDVLDNQVASVKTLSIGVGLGVLQELEEELGRLDGPSSAGDTPLLACSSQSCQSQRLEFRLSYAHHCNFNLHLFRPGLQTIDSFAFDLLSMAMDFLHVAPKFQSGGRLYKQKGWAQLWIVRTLRSAADGAGVTAEGDGLLLLLDILKESDRTTQLPAVDGLGGLAGVLERNTEVGTAGAGRLGGSDLGGSVPNLFV